MSLSVHTHTHRKDKNYHSVVATWVLTHGEQLPDHDVLLEYAVDELVAQGLVLVTETAKSHFSGDESDRLILILEAEAFTDFDATQFDMPADPEVVLWADIPSTYEYVFSHRE